MARTLILSKQGSQFCNSIESVISSLGFVTYKSEHDFAKVMQLVDFVKENAIDQVLMPNPYGNNKRLTCYKKLRESKVKVVASDRGALPNSWFFDQGFNYDSESYQAKSWDKPLNAVEQDVVDHYLKQLRKGESALEKQGDRFGAEKTKQFLGIHPDKKVIFVPLQRPTDTVIKYFSEPIGSVENFIQFLVDLERKLNSEKNEWVFLLKKHPLETAYFSFESENIGYVTDNTNFYDLIEMSEAVLLINSGVGLNALAFEKKVICVGQAFYAHSGLAVHAPSLQAAYDLLLSPDAMPSYAKISRFFHHLISRVYSFGDFITELALQKDGSYRNETKRIRFSQVSWLGEKLAVKTQRVLVVSPLIPFPIYRGNQARIDGVVRWLIKNNYIVDMVVMNTSFADARSIDLKNELMKAYVGINHIEVIKDPSLEKNNIRKKLYLDRKVTPKVLIEGARALNAAFSQKTNRQALQSLLIAKKDEVIKDSSMYKSFLDYQLRKAKDEISGESSSVVCEKNCPIKLVHLVEALASQNSYDYMLLNYVKTAKSVPQDFKGKVIIDTHDYQSQFLEEDQLVNQKNLNINLERYRESEHHWLRKADMLVSINPDEQKIFEKILVGCDTKVKTVPAFFPNEDAVHPRFWRYNFDVLYVGSISNFNVGGLKWFFEKALPIITRAKPDVRIAIAGNVGKSKEIQWEKYAEHVTVLGRVNDLAGLYVSSLCCIAPILGGAGMKIKVVEALSYNKAVIGTSKALEGINHLAYGAVLCADEPHTFADAVLSVMNDAEVRKNLEFNAKRLYNAEHSEAALDENLKAIFSI